MSRPVVFAFLDLPWIVYVYVIRHVFSRQGRQARPQVCFLAHKINVQLVGRLLIHSRRWRNNYISIGHTSQEIYSSQNFSFFSNAAYSRLIFDLPKIAGYSGEPDIPQVLLQVLPWGMRHHSVKLCSSRGHIILQAPFLAALQGEGKLQPSHQVCIDEAGSCLGHRGSLNSTS